MVPLWSGSPTSAEAGVDARRGGDVDAPRKRGQFGSGASGARTFRNRPDACGVPRVPGRMRPDPAHPIGAPRPDGGSETPRTAGGGWRMVRISADRAVVRVRTGPPVPPAGIAQAGGGRNADPRKETPELLARRCPPFAKKEIRPVLEGGDTAGSPLHGPGGRLIRAGSPRWRRGQAPTRWPTSSSGSLGECVGLETAEGEGPGPGGAQVGAQPPEGERGGSLFLFPFPCSACALVLPGRAHLETPTADFDVRFSVAFLLCPDGN